MNQYSNALLPSTPALEASPGHAYHIACQKSIQALHAWLDTLMQFAIYLKRRIRNHADYANTMRELNALDDRTLQELGINRNDFEAIARGRYLTDATRLQRNKAG